MQEISFIITFIIIIIIIIMNVSKVDKINKDIYHAGRECQNPPPAECTSTDIRYLIIKVDLDDS